MIKVITKSIGWTPGIDNNVEIIHEFKTEEEKDDFIKAMSLLENRAVKEIITEAD